MTKSYHHGDLKRAASEVAEQILHESGPDAVTVREIADRIGVTHRALYRHFPDRRGLLAEVASTGFARLEAAVRGAASAKRTGESHKSKFRRVLNAYLGFTLRHKALFRLMYGPELADRSELPGLSFASASSLTLLTSLLAEARGAHELRADGRIDAVGASAYAMAHGLAMLLVNDLLREGTLRTMSRSKLVEEAFACFWDGLGPGRSGAAVALRSKVKR